MRRRWSGAAGPLLALMLAACTDRPTPSTVDSPTVAGPPPPSGVAAPTTLVPIEGYAVPESLARPLDPPTFGDGVCAAQAPRRVTELFGLAAGPGPVYPVGLVDDGLLPLHEPGPKKVLWVAAPSYDGPILVRGARLDGAGELLVAGVGGPATAALHLPPSPAPGTWRDFQSHWSIPGPDCYFWQIDGTDFSYPVVFRVAASA